MYEAIIVCGVEWHMGEGRMVPLITSQLIRRDTRQEIEEAIRAAQNAREFSVTIVRLYA